MSDPSPKIEKSSTPPKGVPAIDAAAAAKKAAVEKALGGPMIPPPAFPGSQRMTPTGPPAAVAPGAAVRVPREPVPTAPLRQHNGIFDAPQAEVRKAREAATQLRAGLAQIAAAIQRAEEAAPNHLAILSLPENAAAAAAFEDFNVETAEEFLNAAVALLDKFKPKA